MKSLRIFILLISLNVAIMSMATNDWHQDVISQMNTAEDVNRNIVVNREPRTKEIKSAVYSYTFKDKKLYKTLRGTLLWHESDAENMKVSSGKYGDIVMKFPDGKNYRSYKLHRTGNRFELIVSVNTQNAYSSVESAETRRLMTEARKQAEEARRQANQQAAEARRQVAEARRIANQQAAEARRQAAEARRQAEAARRQAAEARRQAADAHRQASGQWSHVIIDYKPVNLSEHRAKLQQAESRRKAALRKLNLR